MTCTAETVSPVENMNPTPRCIQSIDNASYYFYSHTLLMLQEQATISSPKKKQCNKKIGKTVYFPPVQINWRDVFTLTQSTCARKGKSPL